MYCCESRTVNDRRAFSVHATDVDVGANAQVEYRFSLLTKSEYRRLFSIEPSTGWIRVQWEIDYETYRTVSWINIQCNFYTIYAIKELNIMRI
ncbi:unnamed protein product [Protopolystoma xenopodis]|uniref:Cadherin domain-containing protein n=1 Tax=Protopolystoma xenopodis TaxID=117903 RepID=A0A3S5AHY5_9PLAT|nr:unnamed protein product [Protopolystoma xenopodis]